jgi:hypothetical protein
MTGLGFDLPPLEPIFNDYVQTPASPPSCGSRRGTSSPIRFHAPTS